MRVWTCSLISCNPILRLLKRERAWKAHTIVFSSWRPFSRKEPLACVFGARHHAGQGVYLHSPASVRCLTPDLPEDSARLSWLTFLNGNTAKKRKYVSMTQNTLLWDGTRIIFRKGGVKGRKANANRMKASCVEMAFAKGQRDAVVCHRCWHVRTGDFLFRVYLLFWTWATFMSPVDVFSEKQETVLWITTCCRLKCVSSSLLSNMQRPSSCDHNELNPVRRRPCVFPGNELASKVKDVQECGGLLKRVWWERENAGVRATFEESGRPMGSYWYSPWLFLRLLRWAEDQSGLWKLWSGRV